MNQPDDYTGTGPAAEVAGQVGQPKQEEAPPNKLPSWDECALRVANSDFIAKRIAEGGYGPEPDSKLASQLHRFIYEYDDADPYRSAWFLHRLELVLQEQSAELLAQRDELARLLKGYVERDEMTRCTNSWFYVASSAALSRIKGA